MSSANSLRPAWHRGNQTGKGFQPPPTVSERGRTQSATIAAETGKTANLNAFAALDDDEEIAAHAAAVAASGGNAADVGAVVGGKGGYNSNSINDNNSKPKGNSRSEALRSAPATRNAPPPGTKPGGGGRSLADLAARVPEAPPRTTNRYAAARSESMGPDETKVIRFTREKLLSMRPKSKDVIPESLKCLEGTPLVSDEAQDPVCWDPNFDAELIWASVPRRVSAVKPVEGLGGRGIGTRAREIGASSGRWQRGVALPPPDQAKKAAAAREKDAESPNELWDDPLAGAAVDFSAFGAMPADEGDGSAPIIPAAPVDDSAPFDFDKMAEATRKFEEEMHSSRSRASSDAQSDDDADASIHHVKIDPKRPLATVGTTIRSGSGDDVNVFEDFDDPAVDPQSAATVEGEAPAIKAADEDPSASSRLMSLIGVVKDEPVPTASSSVSEPEPNILSPWGDAGLNDAVIPLNPWGAPLAASQHETSSGGLGLDIQAHLREAAALEQKKREAEELRRRQEEEAQRRLAQQQAEERARQAAMQQQQAGVQSQVELVLMERISTILEDSWGRADLVMILQSLHAADSRVIPLLSTVDALRALILRHSRRMTIRQDPAFGTEMAILVMTNAQWQQQQQQEARVRAEQEELRRREEQQRQFEEQQKAAIAAIPSVIPNAPWFYSDPQQNIQGPFRSNEMRQWLEAGYFKGDLPISQQPSGPFRPLVAIFPNLNVAFLPIEDTAAEEAAARAKAEAEERQRQEAEREQARQEAIARQEAERARVEAERARQEAEAMAAREAAERERQMREAAEAMERERMAREAHEAAERARREMEQQAMAAKNSNGGNESSAQLKMMLGLSAQAKAPGSNGKQETSAPNLNDRKPAKGATAKNISIAQRGNREVSPPPEPALVPHPGSPGSAPTPGSPAPASVWGAAAAAQPVVRKSMSEIQKEEARAAAMIAQQHGIRPPSSGWANVARAPTAAWSGPGGRGPGVVMGSGSPSGPGQGAKQRQQAAGPNAKPRPQNQQPRAKSTSVAEAFGTNMSPALEKWCKEQMHKVNGTDDITLIAYCNTLNDPVEIRQYFTTYLGASPQVNSFATEFIGKKGLGATKQEEWESTATTKKSRKKKPSGR